MLFLADVVGDLEDPTIAPLTALDTNSTVHFAVYDKGRLEKLILLNTAEATNSTTRSSVTFDIKSSLGEKLKVRRLTGATSDARTGVTWAEQTVDYGGKIQGKQKIERVSNAIVTLFASEAVVVEKQ